MPVEKGSKKTDAQRQAERRYKAGKYKTAACQLSTEKYNQFQAYAKRQGKTVSGLLSAFIDSCITDPVTDPGQPEK